MWGEKLKVRKDIGLYLSEFKIRKNFLRCKITSLYNNFANLTILKYKTEILRKSVWTEQALNLETVFKMDVTVNCSTNKTKLSPMRKMWLSKKQAKTFLTRKQINQIIKEKRCSKDYPAQSPSQCGVLFFCTIRDGNLTSDWQ